MNPQKLANESGQKVYAYRMSDCSIEHSQKYLRVGQLIYGLVIIEVLGAYIPERQTSSDSVTSKTFKSNR